jgi:hypothetical protein
VARAANGAAKDERALKKTAILFFMGDFYCWFWVVIPIAGEPGQFLITPKQPAHPVTIGVIC